VLSLTPRVRAPFPLIGAENLTRLALAALLAIVTMVSAVSQVPSAAAQEGPVAFTTAEAAPADAFAYIVTTTDDESAQWSLADELLDRAGLGEAIDEALAEEMSENGEEIPLDAFLGGEVAVVADQALIEALAAESMSSGEFDAMLGSMGMATPTAETPAMAGQGFSIIIDARAPDTAWAGIQESVREDGEVTESTYEGTTIQFAPPASDDDEGMAAARVGDFILVGIDPADLEPVIDTVDGRAPAITTVPEFTAAREALPGEFLMFAFTNSSGIMDTELGAFATIAGEAATFSGTTIAADPAGFRIESVAIPTEGQTLPAGAANFASELIGAAPADTVFFASGADLGATGVLDAVGATFIAAAFGMGGADAAPDPDASMEEFIAEQYEVAASLIGINLQTEFFQQFAGEYGAWLSAGADGKVNGLFATGTSDPDAVANALMQLSLIIQGASGAESPLTTRASDGGQVYVVDLGDGSTLEFGVVGDRLVIGSGAAVSRLEGEPEGALEDTELFQAAVGTLPAERNGLVYVDLARAIPLVEAASEQTDDLGIGGFEEFPDASESCADYATQEEAQAAYDAAEPDTFDLDQDFDGEVCEDFFSTSEPSAQAEDSGMFDDEAEEMLADVDLSAIQAYAQASYDQDGMARSSAILYIAE
jgi:hypothetical protein